MISIFPKHSTQRLCITGYYFKKFIIMRIPRVRKGLKHSQTKYSFMAAKTTTQNSVLLTVLLENILLYSGSTTGEVGYGLESIRRH